MKRLRIILSGIGIILMIAAIIGVGLIFHVASFARTPHIIPRAGSSFQIRPGESLATISQNLAAQKIISNDGLFKLLVRFKGMDTKIQAGEYSFERLVTPEQVIIILVQGRVNLHKITIPEGLTIKEMALLFEQAGFCSSRHFIDIANDPAFIRSCNINQPSLEGYLFPETYFFPKDAPCNTILSAMTDRFFASYAPEWDVRASEIGLSRHEVVTLASIIEKETGSAPERPVISSVFHNRLKKGMRLESDPTVIYGIKDFNGNIKKKHLREKTPYNTYVIKGLPPGPIASPGKSAIIAALYPVKSPYLFFVSKKNGTHYFSKTVKEHNRAVKKYLLSR